MKRFIDREEELAFLQDEYTREGSSLIVLYGRRRVGKTELCNTFLKGKNSLYFMVTEENEKQNQRTFKSIVAKFCANELLRKAEVGDWETVFELLLEKTKKEKLVVVLDEFQYLGKSNPAFPSIFQKIWDTHLKDENIMIILCGSLISMMESQTLHYSSPLYGRRTGQIQLKQIPFSYYKEFFPLKSRKDLIAYYSVTGGVPKYIELFTDADNVYDAIDKNILKKQSFLYDEPNFLLQREVTEVGSYFSIIKAIAAGNHKLSSIAGALALKQTGLTKYLKTLIDLDILEREVPVTEKNPEKSKKGLYRITDNFVLFWFKFIFPNVSAIESGHSELAMDKIRNNLVDNHISYVYEDICREEMWRMNKKGKWDFSFNQLGRWWKGDEEIDIVAFDSTGSDIIFGECKYWAGKVGVNVFDSLMKKTTAVDWKKESRNEHFVLFSISGFTDQLIEMAADRNDLVLCH